MSLARVKELGHWAISVSRAGLGGGFASRFGLVLGGSLRDVQILIDRAKDPGHTLLDRSGVVGGTDEPFAQALGNRKNGVVVLKKVHNGQMVPKLHPPGSAPIDRLSARDAEKAAVPSAMPVTYSGARRWIAEIITGREAIVT